jgi:hypothetical protein
MYAFRSILDFFRGVSSIFTPASTKIVIKLKYKFDNSSSFTYFYNNTSSLYYYFHNQIDLFFIENLTKKLDYKYTASILFKYRDINYE